jgi:glycosyltransferase involved in cell wall biosynthesis
MGIAVMYDASPAVSVIVPAWGAAHLVGEALASLQAQDFTDWEAIVVDDGAPDDVAGAVAPFAASDPRIRFLATPHGGVSAARNHAIAAARAPLIALLDGDDVYRAAYLSTMVAAIGADPAIGLVTCDAIFTGQLAREGRRFSEYLPQCGEATLDAVIARRFNIFIACLIRREALVSAGGFDETLPTSEDLDLWIRILETGWRAAIVATPLVTYRRRAGSLSSATLKLRRDSMRMYAKTAARLAGRPEAATAAAMAERMRDEAGWVEGEDLVIAGHVAAGIEMLRAAHAESRSPRWRAMMRVFGAFPSIARPVLAWRRRREDAEL